MLFLRPSIHGTPYDEERDENSEPSYRNGKGVSTFDDECRLAGRQREPIKVAPEEMAGTESHDLVYVK